MDITPFVFHVSWLNLEKGKVYAFGKGLEGELGIGHWELHLAPPWKLKFPKLEKTDSIKKIFAGGSNSAATTSKRTNE